jgi:hypothetical protein
MNITVILVIALGVSVAGLAGTGYLLKNQYEKNGALELSNKALQLKVTEINNVLKRTDEIHQTNNALPDDKLFDGLLPTAPGSER